MKSKQHLVVGVALLVAPLEPPTPETSSLSIHHNDLTAKFAGFLFGPGDKEFWLVCFLP